MPGILCEHCTGLCCRYIALPLDPPETARDFDDIRWYLLHEGIAVFVEDGDWYLAVYATCRHLQADNRCGIYATRPRICREYTTDNCDYHSGDYNWEHHFACPQHLDEYLIAHPPRVRRKKRRSGRMTRSSRARTRLGLRRRPARINYAAETTDLHGVPLPVLSIVSGGHA
ncbi:MAG: YkgJ family cysteine cluster protein [Phycisphaerae bacterium]